MGKDNEYSNKLKQLGNRIKTEEPKLPIQEVRPVGAEPTKTELSSSPKKEAHVNFWVPEELMEKLKIQSAISKKSIKQIGIEALEDYLKKRP